MFLRSIFLPIFCFNRSLESHLHPIHILCNHLKILNVTSEWLLELQIR